MPTPTASPLRGTCSLRGSGGEKRGLPAQGEIDDFSLKKSNTFGNFSLVKEGNLAVRTYHWVERYEVQYSKASLVVSCRNPLTSFPLTLMVWKISHRIGSDVKCPHQGLFSKKRNIRGGEGGERTYPKNLKPAKLHSTSHSASLMYWKLFHRTC